MTTDRSRLSIRVPHKKTLGLSLTKPGMIPEQARFDIRTKADAVFQKMAGKTGRIGELPPVPVEHITFTID